MDFQSLLTDLLPKVVTVASVISAVLPAPKPGSFGAALIGLVNILGLNIGHAANATPAALKTETNNTSTTPTMLGLIFVMAVGMGWLSPNAEAASVVFSCTPPTTRVDGTPLTAAEIAGYRFFGAGTSGDILLGVQQPSCSYTYAIAKGSCVQATDLFAVSAVDTDGLESPLSSTVSVGSKVCTPKALPAGPAAVKATAGS